MAPPHDDDLLTLPAAARELDIAHVTLYRHVLAGRLPYVEAGRFRLLRRADVEAFRDRDTKPGPRPKHVAS